MVNMETVVEYTIIFKDKSKIGKEYSGEFITESKCESDKIFEENKEQISQYYSKEWVFIDNDWKENTVNVFYTN